MSLVVDSTYQNMAASLVSPPRSVPNSVYPAGLDSAYSLDDLDGLVTDLRFQHPAAIAKAQSMDISGLQLIRSPDSKSRLSHSAVANASPIMDMASRSPSSNTPNNGRSWPPSNGRGGMHRGKPRALFRDGECRDGSYSSPNSPSVRGRGCMPRGRGSYRGGRGLADPNRRGQGHYRRLWAEVTKVGRGQKLGEGDHTFSDSSVEDMLQLVRGLAPDASAVTAISQGLYYLDRQALHHTTCICSNSKR